jgi:hypothetical protein
VCTPSTEVRENEKRCYWRSRADNQPAPVARTLVPTVDNRLGSCPRLIFHPKGEPLVKFPPEVLKCVAFLEVQKEKTREVRGTTFFVSYNTAEGLEDPDAWATFAITSKHVIENMKSVSVDGNSHLRLNKREGGLASYAIPLSSWQVPWYGHNSDVAIAPLELSFAEYDHLALPNHCFLDGEFISQNNWGVGDEVFFPGLFSGRPGNLSNIPVIRTGNIACMPAEKIKTQYSEFRAYIIEARSFGGFSGSPIFISVDRSGSTYWMEDHHVPSTGISLFFLGYIQGHYNDENGLNTGLALAVPSQNVLGALVSDDFADHRTAALNEARQSRQHQSPVDD